MYIIGIVHWVLFFDLGRIKFNVHDWGLVAHYLRGLQQAVITGQLPLHVLPATDFTVTERFLANPEIPLSPQMLLLSLMDLGPFVLANTLFLYSVGFVGLYALAKRFKLSVFGFALLFLLLVFNGHITAHLGVGHSMWIAYFLTPFLVLLIADAAERGANWRWPVLVSLVLFAILLQGGCHQEGALSVQRYPNASELTKGSVIGRSGSRFAPHRLPRISFRFAINFARHGAI